LPPIPEPRCTSGRVASVLCKRDNYPPGLQRNTKKARRASPARLNRSWELIKSRCILSVACFRNALRRYVSKSMERAYSCATRLTVFVFQFSLSRPLRLLCADYEARHYTVSHLRASERARLPLPSLVSCILTDRFRRPRSFTYSDRGGRIIQWHTG